MTKPDRRAALVARAAVAGLLSGLALGAGCLSPRGATKASAVGVESRVVVDEERGRRIPYEVFYPAEAGAHASAETHAFIYTEWLVRDGTYAGGVRPVLLLSHGTGGTAYDLFWLARAAVERGFIAVAVKHPGDSWDDRTPITSLQVWERPGDVAAALDHLVGDPAWGARVDAARVAVAGHSVGGFTALSAAGLRYDIDRAIEECFTVRMNDPTCVWVRQGGFDFHRIDYTKSGRSVVDERVRAAVAFTPAVAEAADLASARAIDVPVLVVGARGDRLTPFELHAKLYAEWVPTADLVVLDAADHYTPVTPCNAFGRLWLENCQDVPGTERSALQAHLAEQVLRFVAEVFRDHGAGRADPNNR